MLRDGFLSASSSNLPSGEFRPAGLCNVSSSRFASCAPPTARKSCSLAKSTVAGARASLLAGTLTAGLTAEKDFNSSASLGCAGVVELSFGNSFANSMRAREFFGVFNCRSATTNNAVNTPTNARRGQSQKKTFGRVSFFAKLRAASSWNILRVTGCNSKSAPDFSRSSFAWRLSSSSIFLFGSGGISS